MALDKAGADAVIEAANRIADLYDNAVAHDCTCGTDELSCRHCNAWEAAKRESKLIIKSVVEEISNAYNR